MELKCFKEYTYSQIILRLVMEELKKCYANMNSTSWKNLKTILSIHSDYQTLPLISEYINNSDVDSLSTYDDLTHRILGFSVSKNDILDTTYRIFNQFFPNREIKNTAKYEENRIKVSDKFRWARDRYFDELEELLHRENDVKLLVLAKYGNNTECPLLVTISSIADHLWHISFNIKKTLKNKLISGEVIAHGIDKNAKSIDAQIIKKELWEYLEFISSDSAFFNQFSFTNIKFTVKKPDKKFGSNKDFIIDLIKEDYPNEEYQGLKSIDLDELALKYQKILQKTPFYEPYKDIASIRKIIVERFSKLDTSYEKPTAGRPKKIRQNESA